MIPDRLSESTSLKVRVPLPRRKAKALFLAPVTGKAPA